jgi:ribosomal protein S27AE
MSSDGQKTLEVPETDLYKVYSLLESATTAAAEGNPNGCATLASDAQQKVADIHEEAHTVLYGTGGPSLTDHRAICPECGMDTVHAVKRRRPSEPTETNAALTCGACSWREETHA